MCGIAGILRFSGENLPGGKEKDEKVLICLKHRGPDAEGVLRLGNLVLYHTRLRVIDTSSASAQPYHYSEANDGLVYNGEIFNYRDLAASMTGLRSSGDVEVLYRLLREKGSETLNALNGFFAFAYASEAGELLLARDRFGVKPLYYYQDKEKFIFASELRALLELAGPQHLNPNQIYTYFRLNYCSGPETIFKDVYRLLPGQLLKLTGGKTEKQQWYSVPPAASGSDLYTLLDDAVKLRLRADVPSGTFLSGGLDSSVISALAALHKPGLKTFSIGFSDNKYLDESAHAQRVAEHIGSDHHLIRLREEDFIAQIDEFLDAIDEPFADSSAFNIYMLSRYCSKHITVALSGDGADELFKGYHKHRAFRLSNMKASGSLATLFSGILAGVGSSRTGRLSNTKRQAEKLARLATLPPAERLKFLASISNQAEVTSLINEGVSSIYFDSLFADGDMMPGFDAEYQFDVQHVLADDMLVKVDRFSMRHGLEVRNPFLDYRVVEHALNLPESEKLNRRRQKVVLRKTFGRLLPASVLERSKKGFELPLEKWLKNQLKERIEKEWLSEERINTEKLFSYTQINTLKKELSSSSPGDSPAKIWALVVFQHWLRNYGQYILSGPAEAAQPV